MKRYIKSSEGMTANQYMEMFSSDVEALKRFIDSHEADEDGIDLDDPYVLYVRKDENDPDDDHIDIAAYYDDYVDHIVFYKDGSVDKYINYA